MHRRLRRTRHDTDRDARLYEAHLARGAAMNPAKADVLEIREVDESVLVYDSLHEKIHVLNRSAAFVLEHCDSTRAPPELARLLSASSGGDYATVARDVAGILREFANLELLKK